MIDLRDVLKRKVFRLVGNSLQVRECAKEEPPMKNSLYVRECAEEVNSLGGSLVVATEL
jgi:hypothetical protein